ncbi:efflux RND transporter permease subunit [Fredinandcohnia humi]
MKLLKFIVQKKILIGLMIVLVTVFGSYSMIKLDKELMPPIKLDGAFIEIQAGDMSAIEVERSITTPLEQRLAGIEGVDIINSTTFIGKSTLDLTFESGRGEEIYKDVEAIVASVKSDYPGVTDVVSGQYGGNQSYDFFMDVSGGSMEEMSEFAKDILEPRLEELPEVRDVLLVGVLDHEVTIKVDRNKLAKHGLDINQVISTIQQANSEATLGELKSNKTTTALRWNSSIDNNNDIENISILTQNGPIILKDVASVSLQPLENTSSVWKNGSKDFIFVQIGRVADSTQIEMAEAVRKEIKKIRDENLVANFSLNEVVAQADYVQESIDGVKSSIFLGGIIAIVLLVLFLRNIRATFIIALSIPSSVLLTFTAMWLLDYSFNMLTLIGLGLGIGMMVDSSIVILESIYKKKEQGLPKLEAVIEGTKEVGGAVIASMLTTIVVFLPIGLIGGEMGQFVIMLSAVVAITLISSVIIAFTLIPSLAEKILKLQKPKKQMKESSFIRGYGHFVTWTTKKKRNSIAIITLFFIMFAGSLFLVSKIPMTIMPDIFNRYTELAIDLEPGIAIEDREKLITDITKSLETIKDIESSYVMDNGGMLYSIINMTKGNEITMDQKDVNEEILSSLRSLQKSHPITSVQSAMTGGSGLPVQVMIKGESFEELKTLAKDFSAELKEIDGIVAITNSMERTSQEQVVVVKQEKVEEAGLSEQQIKQFIEQSFIQMPVGFLQMDEKNIPMKLTWSEIPESKEDLFELEIPVNGEENSLATFVEFTTVDAPNEIVHKEGERIITISADIKNRDLGAVNRDLQNLIDKSHLPTGYTISIGGDLEEQQELITDMIFIFAIALFLVYLVMAVQFNHLGHPLIVMSIIPITIIGVILGLFLTQMELNLMSGMGIIMLIGIVLNNAILLIDRINQLRREGVTIEEALVEAGKNRMRPILMTTLTTVGGMLPLAMASGASGNYQAPLAVVIISGLSFATVITLFLIPAIYRVFTFSSSLAVGRAKKKQASKAEIAALPHS